MQYVALFQQPETNMYSHVEYGKYYFNNQIDRVKEKPDFNGDQSLAIVHSKFHDGEEYVYICWWKA